MGHEISGNGIRPLESKIIAIEKFSEPKTKGKIFIFGILIGYCSRFIQQYFKWTESLKIHLQRNGDFIWSNKQNKALKELKPNIVDRKTLGYPCKNVKNRHRCIRKRFGTIST